mmetsp:Transcript_22238/g.21479  ORF Transcript_22238/g.21479 Transcript_22238/m.21479 type:complete len:98 (+) Transcript_22238:374-667(+)
MGYPGPYTIGALLFKNVTNGDENVKKCVQTVLSVTQLYQNKEEWRDIEDEILYGSAGYLYALLLLKQELDHTYQKDLDKAIEMVFDCIIFNGSQPGI